MPLESSEESVVGWERLAWVAVVLIAAGLRFFHLGGLPLAAGEAERALAGHALVSGTPPASWNEPTLTVLVAGSFFLFGASDATARLVPALAGVLTVALVWLFRPQWGRWPTLAVATMFACSPSTVAYSRTVAPEALVAAGALALFWLAHRVHEESARWSVPAAGVVLALLFHLGSSAVSVLLVMLAAVVAWWMTETRSRFDGLATNAFPAQAGVSSPREIIRRNLETAGGAAAIAFLVPFTLIGSGLLLYPEGLGFTALQRWLSEFELQTPNSGSLGWLKLLLYEPATLTLGLLGAAVALSQLRREPGRLGLLVWAAAGLLAAVILPDSFGGGILPAILPLLMLGGRVVGTAIGEMDERAWRRGGLAAPVAVVLLVLIVLTVLRPADAPLGGRNAQAIVALGALFVLAMIALWPQAGGPLLPYPAATLFIAGALAFASIHSLAHVSFSAGPTEWFGEPRPDVAALAMLNSNGIRHPAAPSAYVEAASIAVEHGLHPTLPWVLRDQDGVHYVSSPQEGPRLVLVGTQSDSLDASAYTARSLPLISQWYPTTLDVEGLWRWFMVREPYGAPREERRVVLYRRS